MEEKLKRLMQENNITCVTLADRCGSIKLDKDRLEYKKGWRYYTNINYAYGMGHSTLMNDLPLINEFRDCQINKSILTTMVKYVDYDHSEYNHIEDINKYLWKSDISDSGVKVNPDGSISGTIDQLRKFLSFASNHGRYCRSTYKFEDDKVVRLMEIGGNYNLYQKYDSFGEFYHNATVD